MELKVSEIRCSKKIGRTSWQDEGEFFVYDDRRKCILHCTGGMNGRFSLRYAKQIIEICFSVVHVELLTG